MTPDEFRKKLSEWEAKRHVLPAFILEYIDELEKKAGEKKTVYTVRAIYQHDMGVEHRIIYQGTDADEAFRQCYSEISDYIKDEKENYGYPFDDYWFEKEYPNEDICEKDFTGLEVKKMFIDWIKTAIKDKHNISYDLQYNDDWMGEDADGEAGGFELDITEV